MVESKRESERLANARGILVITTDPAGAMVTVTPDAMRAHMPSLIVGDPDLVIRTGGERRISNFLLYGLAYAELYFADVLWPDFGATDLYAAVASYQNRERRFGLTGEQLAPVTRIAI